MNLCYPQWFVSFFCRVGSKKAQRKENMMPFKNVQDLVAGKAAWLALVWVVIGFLALGCTAKRTIYGQPDTNQPPTPDTSVVDTNTVDTNTPPTDTTEPDTLCVPDCDGKTCGDNGCGGSCGSCLDCNNAVDNTLCNPLSNECNVPCCPDCTGKICGLDGCGGTCGSCGQNMYCNDAGQCADSSGCVPDCTNKQCGDNGCGFSCGSCVPEQVCNSQNMCITIGESGGPCNGIDFNGVCYNDKLYFCANDVLTEVDCPAQAKTCLPAADGTGFDCQAIPCQPQCQGKSCGDDGCGGQCGICPVGKSCQDGSCCTPQCNGKNCGDDGCGGLCGTCQGNETCTAGVCVPNNTNDCGNVPSTGVCVANNILKTCVDGAVVETDCAADNKVCSVEPQFGVSICSTPLCVPKCTNKECGMDGCGGSCGTCAMGEFCSDAQTCESTTNGSCAGQCDVFTVGAPCQCDSLCFENNDCCADICTECPNSFLGECAKCESAFPVGSLPFSTTGNTSSGTDLYGFDKNTCPGNDNAHGFGSKEDVWSFIAPTSALYLVTLDPQYDSALYAVTGCPITTSTCLKADEEIGETATEFLILDLQAGQNIFIVVDGWSNSINTVGAYTLTVEYSP